MENQTDKQLEKQDKLDLADRLEALATRIEDANKETARLQNKEVLGGETEAGIIPEPVAPLTPIEYANQVRLGLVNPLQADGYL